MHSDPLSAALPALKVAVTRFDPVWLSEEAQGWHVDGTVTDITGTWNWSAAVDEVGNALGGRWLSTAKGYAMPEDIKAILEAIETAIIMSGADDAE